MAAVAALLTSCSKDDTFGGPARGKVTFEVSTPELATRYGEGTTATNLKYAVYDMIEDATNGKLVDTGTATLNDKHAIVSIDLVEGRKYTAIFWADAGENASPYTFTPATKTVSYTNVNDLTANNEAYDAFYAFVPQADIKVGQTVNVTLKRPFAQLRIETSDTDRAMQLGVEVVKTGITVNAYTSFNLETGAVDGQQNITFKPTDKASAPRVTVSGADYDLISMNYILANNTNADLVDVTLNFTDDVNGTEQNYVRQYNAVSVQRNHRTIVRGTILTDPTTFDVTVSEGFDGDISEDRDTSETLVVSNAAELQEAIENIEDGGTIVLEDNIDDLTKVLLIGSASTINAKAQNSLGTNAVTRTETETPTIVINGNGKTITTSASRAIRITSSNINVIISNLKIVSNAKVVYPNDIHGVSIDDVHNVALTLDNCSVDFTDPSAIDWTYAVNVVGGTGHKVTINGGEYEGANVVNVRGANNTITVNNATLTSMYPDNPMYLGACIWVLQNQGSRVFAKGNTFNGEYAIAFNLGTGTELTESDNIDNCAGVEMKDGVYHIYNAAGLKNILEAAGAAGAGDTKLVLKSNIDMTNIDWTPIQVDGYNGAGVVTLDGNNKTLTGMKDALFAGGFAGGSGIVIKNLTIKNAKIEVKGNAGTGYGAFICAVDSMPSITLENCHLINSSITGNNGSRVGGLIGWTSGYSNKNDGPVKTYVNIKGCSVVGCTLQNAGSIGAINGHAGASDWTYTTIENCVVENNKLTSTDDGDWRVGVVVGTANVGEVIIKDINESGNTLTQTGKTAPEGEKRNYYGRFVPDKTGLLIIDGVGYVGVADGLVAALANENCKSVNLMDNIKIDPANMSNAYGKTGINVKNGQSINGNGHTLDIKGAGGTWDSGINTTGGLIENITVTGSFRGIFINHNSTHSEKVVLKNVITDGTVYTISCDQGTGKGLEATGCTFNGWTSYAATIGEVKFTDCIFSEGSGYAFCRPYAPTEFVGCAFEAGFELDACAAVTFENCTLGGVAITTENLATLVTSNISNASVK